MIAVAAITNTGQRASFSNYGATSVDLAAPGAGTWSTVPSSTGTSTFAAWSGTSMAAPHVAGAVALYKSTFPTATPASVRKAVLDAALGTPTPGVSSTTLVATKGRLNVSRF